MEGHPRDVDRTQPRPADEAARFRRIRTLLWLIVLCSGLLSAMFIQTGHAWGDDFALYIEQAEALLNGSLDSLYAANKFAMDNSPKLMGPYLYPNGFPLLLAPAVALFGLDFVLLKAFCALFLVLSVPLAFRLFRDRFEDLFPVFFLTILFAVHVDVVEHADNVLSDFPFLFLSLASLVLMTKATGLFDQVLLGILIFLSYFTRDLGICLIPALIAHQVGRPARRESKLRLAVPYLVFVSLTGLTFLLFPAGGANHMGVLFTATPATFARNLAHYTYLVGTIFTLAWIPVVSALAGAIPILAGMVLRGRRELAFLAYTISYMAVLVLWPAQQGFRFLIPIVPILAFFWLEGVTWLLERLAPQRGVRGLLAAYLAAFAVVSVGEAAHRAFAGKTNEAYTTEMRAIYSYIGSNVEPEAVLGFAKPRALRLFTDRNAIYTDEAHFDDSVADYFLVDKNAVAADYVVRHDTVQEFPGYLLLSANRPSPHDSSGG